MRKPLLEKLIQEIAMFDMDASCNLHNNKNDQYYNDSDNLDKVMNFSRTVSGNEYWRDISNKLEARRKNYHPHRDLMIEYANDKNIEIQVSINDKWEDIDSPLFFDDRKCRKKPKVSKKVIEYRIYLDKKNKIHMIENKDTLPPHLKQWLGDWQKVEIEVKEND